MRGGTSAPPDGGVGGVVEVGDVVGDERGQVLVGRRLEGDDPAGVAGDRRLEQVAGHPAVAEALVAGLGVDETPSFQAIKL